MRIERVGSEVHLDFTAEEAGLVTVLAHQFADVVRAPELDDARLLALLFPDAYRDHDAASEFRHYTRGELEQRKVEAAEQIAATAQEGRVVLDADALATWVRALTAIRTLVATRIGIRTGDDEPPEGPVADVYEWLGELQWVLVDFLETL